MRKNKIMNGVYPFDESEVYVSKSFQICWDSIQTPSDVTMYKSLIDLSGLKKSSWNRSLESSLSPSSVKIGRINLNGVSFAKHYIALLKMASACHEAFRWKIAFFFSRTVWFKLDFMQWEAVSKSRPLPSATSHQTLVSPN